MWTFILIGTGIIFVVLGVLLRMASEPVNRKDGRARFLELVSVISLLAGTLSLISGVIILILTLSQIGPTSMKSGLFANESIPSQQIKPENIDGQLESGLQSEVLASYPNGNAIEIAGAMATSELKSQDSQTTYYASYAIDGDNSTCWQISGDEESGALTIFLKGKNKVSSVAFNLGNQAEGSFTSCNRPRIIRIDFPTGEYTYATFKDMEDTQTVELSHSINADEFTVTLVDIYTGQNNNTCISEITVYS